MPFFRNGFVAIYFRPTVSKLFPPGAETMRQGLRYYWCQLNTLQDIKICH